MRYNYMQVVLMSLVFLSACKKDDSNNSGSGLSYQLKAANVSNTNVQKSTANASLVWNSGYANPTVVKFEATQQGSQIEYKSTNNAQIDIFAGTAPDFGAFSLPAGTYGEVELRVTLKDAGTTAALHLEGTYTDNSGTLPVTVDIFDEVELKTEVSNVTVSSSSSISAVTELDLSGFMADFTQVLLRNATLTGGKLVISRTSNPTLYSLIVNQMRNRRHHSHFDDH